MHIFFSRYDMTGRAWFRLLLLSIIFNTIVCTVTWPYGFGLFLLPFAIPAGIVIAFVPALLTVFIAAIFARLRGYFSFLQFFVIGTLVSCAIAWRGIVLEHGPLLDHIFFFMRTLPVAWIGGWVVAHVLNVLPQPMPGQAGRRRATGAVAPILLSLVLILVPTALLARATTDALDARELARAAERRGNCPDGLECVVNASGSETVDPSIYAVRMAGRQFIVPANSIYLGISTAQATPGETDVIRLTGLLPQFEPRSATNKKAFAFPYQDVGYATIEPACSPAGYCRTVPIALRDLDASDGKRPVFIRASDAPPAPSGLDYRGDIFATLPHLTTAEKADSHVYATASGDEFILCHTDRSAVSPSCEHTFAREELRFTLRYKRPWLDDWAAIRANAIDLADRLMHAEPPEDVIHLVDRLPQS